MCGLNVVLGVGESCLAFRDFSSLTTHFQPLIVCGYYTYLWRMSSTNYDDILAYKIIAFSLRDRL